MKKIIAFMCAVLLMCVLPIVAFAEENAPEVDATDAVVSDSTVVEEETWDITVDDVVGYFKEHLEEISVIITMLLTVVYQVR